jgi:hypothetical protein
MAGRNMSMKNFNDTIGNRTRDCPACSAVPQACSSSTFTFIRLAWRDKSGKEAEDKSREVTATLSVVWRLARLQLQGGNATFTNNKKPNQALTPCPPCWFKSHVSQPPATSLTSKEHVLTVSIS